MHTIKRVSTRRQLTQILALLLGLLFSTITLADKLNLKDGLAIRGYDPVAYFSDNQAVEGSPSISLHWGGATWQFSSESNRDLFEQDPGKYAPQYGGFCAYAASKGALADADPLAFTVHNGKLYLNFNLQVRDLWDGDRDGNISRADSNWPGLQ